MKYLFDTTAYSHMVRGHERVSFLLRSAETVYIPNVVIAELRFGFRFGNLQEENNRLLARFMAKRKIQTLLPDTATTDYFINAAYHARKNGIQLSTHDLWIAALSEQWDATLVTFDRDFKHLSHDNLKLEFLTT